MLAKEISLFLSFRVNCNYNSPILIRANPLQQPNLLARLLPDKPYVGVLAGVLWRISGRGGGHRRRVELAQRCRLRVRVDKGKVKRRQGLLARVVGASLEVEDVIASREDAAIVFGLGLHRLGNMVGNFGQHCERQGSQSEQAEFHIDNGREGIYNE